MIITRDIAAFAVAALLVFVSAAWLLARRSPRRRRDGA